MFFYTLANAMIYTRGEQTEEEWQDLVEACGSGTEGLQDPNISEQF